MQPKTARIIENIIFYFILATIIGTLYAVLFVASDISFTSEFFEDQSFRLILTGCLGPICGG